ncbi:MAG: hypothetical protein RIE60_22200 [Roseovarius sp.]
MSPPVTVLGMHRSGISLVSACLEAAGLFLGEVNTSAPSCPWPKGWRCGG